MIIESFSPKQREIFAFMKNGQRSLICDGAVRSGKTVVMMMSFFLWAMAKFDGMNLGICAHTVTNAERNIIQPFLQLDAFKGKCEYNRSMRCLVGHMNGRTNFFYLFGGKDESSYTLVQGITLAGALLDEVALMPKSFVDQVLTRCLSVPERKYWFNCNPEGQLHWFNQEWILPADEGKKPEITHLHFLMSDNPIMGEKDIAETASMFSGVFYQRYILGLWVMAEGLIYDCFSREEHIFTNEPAAEGEYYVSCDFGIQNATVFLLWRKEKGSDRWLCLREWYYSGRTEHAQKTCAELCAGLREMLGDVKPKQVIVDPSAAALIAELRRAGFHVRQADNDVRDGIMDVSQMLKDKRLAFSASCRNTINEFGVYCWDEKAAQHGEDKPVKTSDHAMDAVRYLVKTLRLVKPKAEFKSIYAR